MWMTFVYIAIILFQLGLLLYFVRRNRKKVKSVPGPADNSFEGQRRLALEVTPSQLNLTVPANQTFVYGVVMDWNTGDSLATLATYINGAANLYLSNGDGVRGGGRNVTVGEAAAKFVAAAQDYALSVVPVSDTGLPPDNCVRFYFLTNRGLAAAQEEARHFKDNSSSWLPLFKMGNEVITEMMNS